LTQSITDSGEAGVSLARGAGWRFAAANIRHLHGSRTVGIRALPGTRIDPGLNDVVRLRHVQRQRIGLAHETGPDLQRTGRPGERRLAVVVTTQPDHRQQILTETGEPTVARVVTGTGLARQRQVLGSTL
jgi:hypothetical protein